MLSKRLFIIGNGFDICHKLPTRYNPHFRNIAERMDWQGFWSLYSCDEESLWSDFESSLSYPDFSSLTALFDGYYPDYLSDHESDRDGIITQVDLVGHLESALDEFANNAENELACARPLDKFFQCFNPDDLYVNFNYTSTLQDLYEIDESHVLHIHGHVGYSPLLLGYKHGTLDLGEVFVEVHNGRGYMQKTEDYTDGIEDYYVHTAYDGLIAKLKTFSKPSMVETLSDFLAGEQIDEIVIVGHSMGSCDSDYFVFLNQRYPSAKWLISYHSDKDLCKERIRALSPIPKYELWHL